MATLKKYNLAGKEVGDVQIDDKTLETNANSQMIKDYIIAIRANARQWSAHTKSRSEVSHSGQKPHPQKGTGRARQGYLGAPQYKGGGRVGGPRAKFDQHVSINKKEKRAAIRHLIIEKIQNEQILVLDASSLKAPKTGKIAEFMKGRSLSGKRILCLGSEPEAIFTRSLRNIPKTEFLLMSNASGYDLATCQHLIVLEPALEQLLKMVEG